MFSRDLARRIGAVEERMHWIDEHGTRSVDVMRQVQQDQAADLVEIKGQVAMVDAKVQSILGRQWQRILAFCLAVAPIYVMLFIAVRGLKAGG